MATTSKLARRARRGRAAGAVSVLAVVLSACTQTGGGLGGGPAGTGQQATTLTASPIYTRANPDEAPDRLTQLKSAIDRLREVSASGWIGRQDDETGYLAELTGGGYTAEGAADVDGLLAKFFADYGLDLFGVGLAELDVGEQQGPPSGETTTLRATQQLGSVPVLDAGLQLTVTSPEADPRLNVVRGRVFPGLTTDTTPRVSSARATRIAQRLSGGSRQGTPDLFILPSETGRLVWEVAVAGTTTTAPGQAELNEGLYYIDALTGEFATVRPAGAESRTLVPGSRQLGLSPRVTKLPIQRGFGPLPIEPDPNSVSVSGSDPAGVPLTGYGVQLTEGIGLVDTTVPTYDSATQRGGLLTFDATGLDEGSEGDLPGELYLSDGPEIRDQEALAAHAYSRVVYDYYASLGRASWDDAGGPLISSVNFGPADFCNSYFSSNLDPPQMVYGNPCTTDEGQAELTEVDVDTAGHEITHGVISTSANLNYTGQSGALNESFADFFGNVIGDRSRGTDSAAVFEGSCQGFTEDTLMCHPNPDGTSSLRYLLNENTFDDYLRVLDLGIRGRVLGLGDQDHGGVHLNSAIWNNALWSIRSRLAQIDGTTGVESAMAADFDKIVYAALTRQIGPSSGFIDARQAIEQTIVDAGADAKILTVTQEVFDANNICVGCTDLGNVPGLGVTTAPQTQLVPAVSGDQVAWVDLASAGGVFGSASGARVGDDAVQLGPADSTALVGFAGEALIALDEGGSVERFADDEAPQPLDEVDFFPTLAAGLAGSDAGGAWVSGSDVVFVDPEGQLTRQAIDLGGDTVTSIGTGDGTVVFGTDGGTVYTWTPGSEVVQIGTTPGAALAVAAFGERVTVVDDEGNATVLAGNAAVPVSESAAPFGAAMNDEYAVWAEASGPLEAGVAGESSPFPDTDLYLYSFETGQIYNLMEQLGQQGFPALSGDRLVWQDAVFGGDDILTATIPSGL